MRNLILLKIKGQDLTPLFRIGLAIGTPHKETSSEKFLRLTDNALYVAKESGRNRLEALSIEDSD